MEDIESLQVRKMIRAFCAEPSRWIFLGFGIAVQMLYRSFSSHMAMVNTKDIILNKLDAWWIVWRAESG
jgi:hypothetical protein